MNDTVSIRNLIKSEKDTVEVFKLKVKEIDKRVQMAIKERDLAQDFMNCSLQKMQEAEVKLTDKEAELSMLTETIDNLHREVTKNMIFLKNF